MELNSFKNKVVIKTSTGERLYLIEITSPALKTVTVEKDRGGHHTFYSWPTINGTPFEKGYLRFEEEGLEAAFKEVFDAYSRTKDAFYEEYGYWMRKD